MGSSLYSVKWCNTRKWSLVASHLNESTDECIQPLFLSLQQNLSELFCFERMRTEGGGWGAFSSIKTLNCRKAWRGKAWKGLYGAFSSAGCLRIPQLGSLVSETFSFNNPLGRSQRSCRLRRKAVMCLSNCKVCSVTDKEKLVSKKFFSQAEKKSSRTSVSQ